MNCARLAATTLVTSVLGLTSLYVQAQSSAPLVQKANMVHVGSFRVPNTSGNGFNYGGGALAYNPANNSLFISGHVHDNHTAEISIPGTSGTASIIQGLSDSLAGRIGQIGSDQKRIGGNLVYKNRLYVTAFLYYDGSGSQSRSHFSRPLSLTGGSVNGPLQAGPKNAGFYSGYMGHVPPEWQSRLGGPALTGNCCLSIISRTSYGPAAFAFDPENIGNAQALVWYDGDHQTVGVYGASGVHPVFNGTTRITGIVFPEGTASVLFVGMTGVGNYCYGEGAQCGDPSSNSKGEHAYPYKGYVWAYDANDLEDVRRGSRQPWQVVPYATWELNEMGNINTNDFGVGGAAYDPSTGRIYVSKKFGDGERPVIYVYEVNNSAMSVVPEPPASLVAE